jgi:hypothetical protein
MTPNWVEAPQGKNPIKETRMRKNCARIGELREGEEA